MSFLRKGILVSAGQVFSIPLSMAAGVIFARALGPDGVGQYELFRTTSVLAVTFVALGLGQANIYLLNNRAIPTTRIATNTLKAGMALGGVLAMGLIVAVLGRADYFGHVAASTAVCFAVGAGTALILALLRPILVAQMAARRMVTVDLSSRVFILIVGGLLAVFGVLRADVAILAFAGSNVFAFALLVYMLRAHLELRQPFEWRLFGEMLSYGAKLAATNILLVLSTSVTVMLLRWLGREGFGDVGLYTRAVAVCSLVTLVPTALGPLLYAKWAGTQGDERRRQAEMASRMNLVYGAVSCTTLLLVGKYVIWLLYGREFIPAVAALHILAPAMLLAPLYEVCNNLLAGDGRATVMATILAGTLAIVAGVTYTAAPSLGIQGAALGALCGNAFTVTMGFVVCRRLYGLRIEQCLVLRRSDVAYVYAALRKRPAQASLATS